jgi:hypothetical protein
MNSRTFVVTVSGGLVSAVYSPDPDDQVLIIDYDDIEDDPGAYQGYDNTKHVVASLETDEPTLLDGTALYPIY